jgi:hypothetical protein
VTVTVVVSMGGYMAMVTRLLVKVRGKVRRVPKILRWRMRRGCRDSWVLENGVAVPCVGRGAWGISLIGLPQMGDGVKKVLDALGLSQSGLDGQMIAGLLLLVGAATLRLLCRCTACRVQFTTHTPMRRLVCVETEATRQHEEAALATAAFTSGGGMV